MRAGRYAGGAASVQTWISVTKVSYYQNQISKGFCHWKPLPPGQRKCLADKMKFCTWHLRTCPSNEFRSFISISSVPPDQPRIRISIVTPSVPRVLSEVAAALNGSRVRLVVCGPTIVLIRLVQFSKKKPQALVNNTWTVTIYLLTYFSCFLIITRGIFSSTPRF